MYSDNIIAERLSLAKEALGWVPEVHSTSEVDLFNEGLERRYAKEYETAWSASSMAKPDLAPRVFQSTLRDLLCNPAKPKLSMEEVRWMTNEQYLCMCSAVYWMTRYYWIKNIRNEFQRFTFRPAQQVYLNIVSRLEERKIAIEILFDKARQLGLCLHPDTKVLKSNFEYISIDELKEGDRIISVDEDTGKGRGNHRRLRESVVEKKRDTFQEAYRIKFEDGREIIATGQHRFLGKSHNTPLWQFVKDMKVGDEIRSVADVWTNDRTSEDYWFGGLADGEGSIQSKSKAGCSINVSQAPGPVLDRAKQYLSNGGYSFREEWDNRKSGESSKLGNKPVCKLVVGRIDEIWKLIHKTQPTRFKESKIWIEKELPRKSTGNAWAKIISIEPLPQQRMVDIQTSEHTFIAEGLVSHNSTETEGFIGHLSFFRYGTNATIASYDQAKTAEMSKMLFLAYDMMPWWMRPIYTRRVESDRGMLQFGGQRSGVSFQHGKQTSGISQGTTPTVYHLSEVAYYPDPLALIEVGLFKAVHPSPKVFGVLESTAAGDVGWWPDKYWFYKKNWPACRMYAAFLPWFLGTDLYPNPTFLQQNPMPSSWEMIPETREMVARAEQYVDSNSLLKEVLGSEWMLAKEQAWWWQTLFMEARDGGKERTFFQEYPTDDLESFQGSYDNVFGRETIAEAYSNRERDYEVFSIIGQSIEDKNEPDEDEIDFAKKRIPIKYESRKGVSYHWELVPLRWKENWESLTELREAEIPNGLFMVFIPPERGYDYSIGVDTSTGIGDEATVIAVSRRARDPGEPDVQVAEFRSNLVSHVEAYPYVMAIASYYSRYMAESTSYREPYVSVEQVAAVGDTVYKDMWKMGYSRFHRFTRYDSKPKDIRKTKSKKMGWFTFGWSRPILTDNFVVAVQNGWYVLNSPWTIWECQHWEVHLTQLGKQKNVHSQNSTDDGIFANAMAFFCPNDLMSLTERTKKKYMRNTTGARPLVDLGSWGAMMVKRGEMEKL